jgi:hypothetical protein
LSLDTSLDAKHLLEGVFVAVLHLEGLPLLPEGGVCARIAELRSVTIDSASTVNLAKPTLHFSKLEAHFLGLLVGQRGDSPLIDRPCGGEAEVGCGFGDVELEHLEPVFVGNGSSGTLVDAHCVARKSTFFFQVAIHQVKRLGEFGWTFIKSLLKEIS